MPPRSERAAAAEDKAALLSAVQAASRCKQVGCRSKLSSPPEQTTRKPSVAFMGTRSALVEGVQLTLSVLHLAVRQQHFSL